jgi:nicotinamidase-related amidase
MSNALIVIDVQNAVMDGTHDRDAVVANVARLVDAAEVPVVFVQHESDEMPNGSDGWRFVPELAVDGPVVGKRYPDAFEDTNLADVLAELDARSLIICGAQTDECVRSTLHGAIVRGYDATLVSDAHTTEDLSEWGAPTPDLVIAHTNLYWGNHQAPGRTAGTVTTDQAIESLRTQDPSVPANTNQSTASDAV